jgi:shikimate dehydrogenase
MVTKDTTICISIAARPGNFGTTLHNAGYQHLGLDFLYKAFGVTDLAGALAGVRALGIRGCSVSMPFKEEVLPLMDRLDPAAKAVGAVNCVVNDSGVLTGYNTDWVGARSSLDALAVSADDSVLILGAGGVARAILYSLRTLNVRRIRVAARDVSKVAGMMAIWDCDPVRWDARDLERPDVLVNATPIGMTPDFDDVPVGDDAWRDARGVFDVVVSPMVTELARRAQLAGKDVAPGHVMSLYQAAAQFRAYTGEEPPMDVLRESLEDLLMRS